MNKIVFELKYGHQIKIRLFLKSSIEMKMMHKQLYELSHMMALLQIVNADWVIQ